MGKKKSTMEYCSRCGSNLKVTRIDGVKRYICSSDDCGSIYWNNPVPVVAALVLLKNRYIIARNSAWPKDIFSLITGYLEEGESPQEAVIREVSEELGLKGHIKRQIGNYVFKEKNQVVLCYEVEALGDIVTNHELSEIKKLTAAEFSAYDFSPLYITEQIQRDWSTLQAKCI